ncbi:hypothetical protein [Salinigranum rubrum]|uniref:hypothetical protein n=1 Tax=Salinigranum rubrum TaxID=755307 RepID=UPI0013A59A9B|nr:hypothetical protein [Salinigranum rubrum]
MSVLLREAVASTTPAEGAAHAERLLGHTLSDADVDPVARYLACAEAITTAPDRDPAWLPWLVGDALARTVRTVDSPFGDRDAQVAVVARVTALAVHHRRRELDALDVAGDDLFERIVTGVRTVEHDDRPFFERVVRETATLLDEEDVGGSAVLDWQDAFDDV